MGKVGVRLIAMSSILLGVGVVAVSGWILHRAIQAWKNPTLKTSEKLLSQVNTFFGGTTGLYDLNVIYRIITACSAVTLCGGFVQFVMSFWLLLAAARGGGAMARCWVWIHLAVMCAIGGGFLCIITNELQITVPIYVFLALSGADFLLLIYFVWAVYVYASKKREPVQQ